MSRILLLKFELTVLFAEDVSANDRYLRMSRFGANREHASNDTMAKDPSKCVHFDTVAIVLCDYRSP